MHKAFMVLMHNKSLFWRKFDGTKAEGVYMGTT